MGVANASAFWRAKARALMSMNRMRSAASGSNSTTGKRVVRLSLRSLIAAGVREWCPRERIY